jgi:DUF971 family protein
MSNLQKAFPVEFHLVSADAVLEVEWSNGDRNRFSLKYLRGWCPCAGCQGHFTGFKRFIDQASHDLVNIEPVGTYAVRMSWADGHSSGIYAFSYLLELAAAPPDVGPSNDDCLAGRTLH